MQLQKPQTYLLKIVHPPADPAHFPVRLVRIDDALIVDFARIRPAARQQRPNLRLFRLLIRPRINEDVGHALARTNIAAVCRSLPGQALTTLRRGVAAAVGAAVGARGGGRVAGLVEVDLGVLGPVLEDGAVAQEVGGGGRSLLERGAGGCGSFGPRQARAEPEEQEAGGEKSD